MRPGTAALGLLVVMFMFLLVLMPLPVHAASTLIQQNNNECDCASLPVSFTSNVVSGNVIVVGVTASQSSTLSTVSDSLSSSFTQAVTSSDTTANAYIFYATVSSGGADMVTATFSGVNVAGIFVYEISGVMTTGATTGSNVGVIASMSTSPTIFQAGAFLLGVIGTNNAGFVATAGAGFTLSATTFVAFAEYSTSGVSSPTTFPASTNFAVRWAEAGLALQPAPTPPPIPEYPLGLSILVIFMLVGYGLVKRKAVTKK